MKIRSMLQALRGLFVSPARAAATAAAVPSALTLAVVLLIQPWEGNRLVPYQDVGGIWTVCAGVTGPDVVPGRIYTEAECRTLNEKHARIHAESAQRLVTFRPVPDLTMAAFISFHYNVGPAAFSRSTLLKKANAGDLLGACEQLSRWVKVGTVTVRGLENRRVHGDATRLSERTVCLIGLDPSYRTPLFERLILQVKP